MDTKTLLKIIRHQYLTLGFYATPYNYDQRIGLPDGSWKTGIEMDKGHDARDSGEFTRKLLGDDPVETIDRELAREET